MKYARLAMAVIYDLRRASECEQVLVLLLLLLWGDGRGTLPVTPSSVITLDFIIRGNG
jgi:hypothetical protein